MARKSFSDCWAEWVRAAPQGFWPIHNHGELAVTLCFTFLLFAAFGGGAYSLDALFFGARVEQTADALHGM